MPAKAKDVLDRRRGDQRAWLKEHAPEVFKEQAHLNDGSRERTYWHYGYMVALTDVLRLLERESQGQPQGHVDHEP
jgi:uncharacterized protein YecT (DUF1311 family)